MSSSSVRDWASVLGPAAAAPAAGLTLFSSAGQDDAYITYWAARSLSASGEILNYNGDRIEQSSSPLHTLLLAVGDLVTPLSMSVLGFLSGVVFAALAVALAVVVARRIEPGAGLSAGILTATSAYFVYWSFGGMEATIVAFCFLLALWAASRVIEGARGAGLLPALGAAVLFSLGRPESGLVLAAALAGFAVLAVALPRGAGERRFVDVSGSPLRGALLALAAGVAGFAAVTLARLGYFGEPFPQPVRAKVGGLEIARGLDYLGEWLLRPYLLILAPILVLSLVQLWRRRTALETLLWSALAAHLAFVVTAGGDWMEAGRLVVPALPLAAVLAGVAIARLPARGWRVVLVSVLLAAQVGGLVHLAATGSAGLPIWAEAEFAPTAHPLPPLVPTTWPERKNRVHVRDAAFLTVLEATLERLSRNGQVRVASGQAGMVAYYAMGRFRERIHFIDIGSITTDEFHRCREGLIRGRLGWGMPFDYWIEHEAQCAVPLPDVVYGLGYFESRAALSGRYRLVYQQPGVPIVASRGPLEGAAVTAEEFVAVRTELFDLVRGIPAEVVGGT